MSTRNTRLTGTGYAYAAKAAFMKSIFPPPSSDGRKRLRRR